jgi:hypothetical protein
VSEIVAVRNGTAGRKYLVRWKDCTAEQDTWEPIEHLVCAKNLVLAYDQKRVQDAAQEALEAAAARKKALEEKQLRDTANAEMVTNALAHSQGVGQHNDARSNACPFWKHFGRRSDDKKHSGAMLLTLCLRRAGCACVDYHVAVCLLPKSKNKDDPCAEMLQVRIHTPSHTHTLTH